MVIGPRAIGIKDDGIFDQEEAFAIFPEAQAYRGVILGMTTPKVTLLITFSYQR
jgi:hypothetical protein